MTIQESQNQITLDQETENQDDNKPKNNKSIVIQGKTYQLATLNRRLIASVLDMFIITILFSPIIGLMNYFIYKGRPPQEILEDYVASEPNSQNIFGLINYLSQQGIMTRYIIAQLISLVIFGIFITLFWKYKGATFGKMIARCKVIDATTGEIPTSKQSIIRFLGYILSTLPLCLGFIMVAFTKKRQALHDKLANTLVAVVPWKTK